MYVSGSNSVHIVFLHVRTAFVSLGPYGSMFAPLKDVWNDRRRCDYFGPSIDIVFSAVVVLHLAFIVNIGPYE